MPVIVVFVLVIRESYEPDPLERRGERGILSGDAGFVIKAARFTCSPSLRWL
jgi:hypothetical protein